MFGALPGAPSSPNSLRQELSELLLRRSLLRGEFVLASGRRSSYYLDIRRTSLHPRGAVLIARLLFDAIRGSGAQAVGGLTLGADPLACSLAALSSEWGQPLPAFLVRKGTKEHGTGARIEGGLEPGTRVALLEDVVTTGGSALEAAGAVREVGCPIVGVWAVVDREQGGREALAAAGLGLTALFTARELLDLAGIAAR
ncbi:MAG TPA: orotate phosphoribosyltransferase [Candidatus Saccharimonadales bacterium]|nr:orotate phosphoribosyltransferase [Candidatus Saccharimonadales bacterium]